MQINRKLNLVVPIEGESGPIAYIHAMPISFDVFEAHAAVLARTYAAIYELGIGNSCGPNMAHVMLKRIAEQLTVWDDVQSGLLAEMRRLSNVVYLTANGWETVMLDQAVKQNLIDTEDLREAEGALVFFTVVSAVSRRKQIAERLRGPGLAWGFQTTSQSPMELAASLAISTMGGNSGETTPGSLANASPGLVARDSPNGATTTEPNAARPKSSEVVTL